MNTPINFKSKFLYSFNIRLLTLDDLENWLKQYSIPYDHIFLREDSDYRSDDIIKKEIYEQKIQPNWNIEVVLDDRNRVVKMWREIGLTCFQVNDGDF